MDKDVLTRRFTLDGYNDMLSQLLDAHYIFQKFQNINMLTLKSFVLLRHDIDFCLEDALPIAECEYSKGVQSTYFIQLRSPLYNILSNHASRIVNRIYDLGHDIALHFDPNHYSAEYAINLTSELECLLDFYPYANNKIVSFHRPGKFALSLQDLHLPNKIGHVYEKNFFVEVEYFSDSKGQWGNKGYPIDSLTFMQKKPMQVLIHPLWWIEDGSYPMEKLDTFIKKQPALTAKLIENTAITFSIKDLYT